MNFNLKDNFASFISFGKMKSANFLPPQPLYDPSLSVTDKINKVAKEIYRADEVNFTEDAKKQLKTIKNDYPICIAKTQYSFSDNASLLNAPTGHTFTVREVKVNHGAEFNVVLSDAIMTMPGLPKVPAAEHITVEPTKGEISGLF
jgi:formate--tetrahydrofolate ligase